MPTVSGPVTSFEPFCAPLTKKRSVVPSNVTAMCDHAPVGSAAVPRAVWSALVRPQPAGRRDSSWAYSMYEKLRVPRVFTITGR